MPTSTSKKIESFANVAIIIVALLFAIAFVKNYVLTKSATSTNSIATRNGSTVPPSTESLISPGSKLSISSVSDLKLANSSRTLILALSNTCHFCTESASFYKKVAQMRPSTRLIAVLPQSVKEGQKYLTKLGVAVDEVTQLNLEKIGILATPTIVLIDNDGIIKQSWIGKLSPEGERSVLNAIQER